MEKRGSNLSEILTHKKTPPYSTNWKITNLYVIMCMCGGGGVLETSLINMVLRWFFEKYQQIYNMSEFSLLERGHGPSFFFNLNPLNPTIMLGVKCSWNRFSGSGEKVESVKSLWTDARQNIKRKAYLSFQLKWAKMKI